MRTTLTFGRLVLHIHWAKALAVLLLIAGLTRLGIWQLDRAQQKIDQQLAFQAAGERAPVALDEVPIAGITFDALQHQNKRVALTGHYLNDRNIYLVYQAYQERIGWEIITPFQVDGDDQIALVSRGWSGLGTVEELTAALPAITGTVTVEGQLYVPTPQQAAESGEAFTDTWPRVQRRLNVDELTSLFSAPLFPYVVRLAEKQPGLLVRHWPEVLVDSGRNFSYALQWFAMAIAAALASLFLASNAGQLWKAKRAPL